MTFKFCKFCNENHPLTTEYWSRLESWPKCKKAMIEYSKKWNKVNKDKKVKNQANWRNKNKDKIIKINTEYRKNNKDKITKYMAQYQKKRRALDSNFKLINLLVIRLNKALKNNYKSGSAVKDLGCSIEYLKQYLESKFQSGMNWSNHGKWHIDHIIPLSSFDLTDRNQLLKACHYTNLQPLWAIDNIRKGAKIN